MDILEARASNQVSRQRSNLLDKENPFGECIEP